jgi:hypothetical protein
MVVTRRIVWEPLTHNGEGNQQPSLIFEEGSTTREKSRRVKRPEAPSPSFIEGEDIVWSTWKHVAVLKRTE